MLDWVFEWFRFTVGPGRPNPERCSNSDFTFTIEIFVYKWLLLVIEETISINEYLFIISCHWLFGFRANLQVQVCIKSNFRTLHAYIGGWVTLIAAGGLPSWYAVTLSAIRHKQIAYRGGWVARTAASYTQKKLNFFMSLYSYFFLNKALKYIIVHISKKMY